MKMLARRRLRNQDHGNDALDGWGGVGCSWKTSTKKKERSRDEGASHPSGVEEHLTETWRRSCCYCWRNSQRNDNFYSFLCFIWAFSLEFLEFNLIISCNSFSIQVLVHHTVTNVNCDSGFTWQKWNQHSNIHRNITNWAFIQFIQKVVAHYKPSSNGFTFDFSEIF